MSCQECGGPKIIIQQAESVKRSFFTVHFVFQLRYAAKAVYTVPGNSFVMGYDIRVNSFLHDRR